MIGESRSAGSRQPRAIWRAPLDNYDTAQQIAALELHRRRNPARHLLTLSLSSVGTKGGGQHAQQLVRMIGEQINVSET